MGSGCAHPSMTWSDCPTVTVCLFQSPDKGLHVTTATETQNCRLSLSCCCDTHLIKPVKGFQSIHQVISYLCSNHTTNDNDNEGFTL